MQKPLLRDSRSLPLTALVLIGYFVTAAAVYGLPPDSSSESDSPAVLHVTGDIKKPIKIRDTPPRYTPKARKARVQGVVIVQAVIDRKGDVADVKVLKGLPNGLSEAAVKAVKKWKFKPATLDGEPVAVYYNLTINFRLELTPTAKPMGGKLENPKPIHTPQPLYTDEARAAGIEGEVVMRVKITKRGDVAHVFIIEGLPHGLSDTAVEAVKEWKFEPATLDGKPVAVFHNFTAKFRLD